MPRYWVSLGNWNEANVDGSEEEEIELKMEKLATRSDENGLTFKTESLEEAKEVQKKAREIIKKYYPDNDAVGDSIQITTQPECPKCGNLGRFADLYCSSCGTELTPKQYVE